jgi:peptide/nickel transport system substrate-binding protein
VGGETFKAFKRKIMIRDKRGETFLSRRTFLKTAAGAGALATGGAIGTPAISQRAAARALRLVPHADVSNFDPIWSTAWIARNAGLLVWDTLYGVDAKLQVQRQMIEAEEVSADGLTWTFRLRPGLKFHDGESVLAKDAVASINRWAPREPMGVMIKAVENELTAIDDRTFRWALKRPFPKMLLALGKIGTPCCFIMPARIAATDPYRQISEYVGSGPMRFATNEWVPGAKAVFDKFPGYVPRQEPASWLAGGKNIVADRIEWVTIPDAATASLALQSGEIDWWEKPISDLVPLLKKNRNVIVDIADPLGNIGIVCFNHLNPPFQDVRARRAILMALSQTDYMRSYFGDDDKMWRPLPGFFTPGTPLYNEEGGEILKGPRNFDAAKRLLAESGYADQPVTCLAAQDIPEFKPWGEVTAELLKRLNMKVDFAAIDWGTVIARRAQKSAQGGWHMYPSSLAGADCVDPTNKFIRANGETVATGWPRSQEVECAPLGSYLCHQAWRKNIIGVGQGPLPFFWGVSKTV